MKKLVMIFALVALPLGASALPMTFTDIHDPSPDALLTPTSGHSFTHDVNDDGFNAATDTVLSVMLDLNVADDGDYDYSTTRTYRYTTWCGRHSRWGRYHCHYGYRSYTTPGQLETLTVDADGSLFGAYEIDYNPLGIAIAPADIQGDGLLSVALRVGMGDLWFRQSTLTVNVDRRVSVPEPATLALFGIGLIGLALVRQRRRPLAQSRA